MKLKRKSQQDVINKALRENAERLDPTRDSSGRFCKRRATRKAEAFAATLAALQQRAASGWASNHVKSSMRAA